MSKIATWVNAARLRTLPLSISGVVVGTAMASFYERGIDVLLFVFALLAAIGFQVTSNFANDYGDGVKGTDGEDRIGPKRALQSGLLSRAELKRGILISIAVNSIFVLAVVYRAFGTENFGYLLLFVVLGGASIWAALKYTIGNKAYGYRGMGDIFVFLFFGLLAVLGAMFLYVKYITPMAVLPAVTIGLLSVGVLNLNNLRDYDSDKGAGKNTMVVLMGFNNGKRYHAVLLMGAFVCLLIFSCMNFIGITQFIPLVPFVLIFLHLVKVYNTKTPILLDAELKKLALSTFLMALLFFMCYYNFL